MSGQMLEPLGVSVESPRSPWPRAAFPGSALGAGGRSWLLANLRLVQTDPEGGMLSRLAMAAAPEEAEISRDRSLQGLLAQPLLTSLFWPPVATFRCLVLDR